MEVVIEKLDYFGRGICYVDSRICFVEGALPQETVEIEITKETKKFLEAKTIRVLKQSSDRITPACPYYGKCGGCSLQHMSFESENNFKMEKVKDVLFFYGNISSLKILPICYHNEFYYRNKITLHRNGNEMGLYENESHKVVSINQCLLTLPKINETLKNLPVTDECIVKCSNDGKSVLTSNDSGKLLTTIGDVSYYQSISSFFQVNSTLTKDLYDEVLKVVKEVHPNRVLDLYCGTGTIGIYVSKYCVNIVGIDYNSSNIEDAKENAKLNQVKNIEFICDKVENRIDSFKDIDFIIVDPPRSGLDSKTRKILLELKPSKIVYVSCDIFTLARDLKDLSNLYDVTYVRPFNMFPRTSHVECVCVLNR